MATYCSFFAVYNTEINVDINEKVVGDDRIVTAKMTVEFNKPMSIDKRTIPLDHVPANPSDVGKVNKARLTYYTNNEGSWLYNVIDLTDKNAKSFYRTIARNTVTEVWTFVYTINASDEWDSFRGQFKLLDIYENQYSYAECAYYSSANIMVYNGDDSLNPEGCKPATFWEPSDTDLPEQTYDVIPLNAGDMFGMQYPTTIKDVYIAPPSHFIPYAMDKDYHGCYRNNIVQLSFEQPGIYAVRVNFVGGSDTRFFSVDTVFANDLGPFSRMVAFPTPNYTTNFSYSTVTDYAVYQAANTFLPDIKFANTSNIVSDLNNYQGVNPLTLLICGDGDASEVFMDNDSWHLDANCQPTLSLNQFVTAAHGCVNAIYIFNPMVAKGLTSTCHLMKYIATSLETTSPYNPYGSPYRPPLGSATVYAFDTPIAIVAPGDYRDGFFCYSQSGGIQQSIAYPGSGLVALASERKSTKEKPSFYNMS